MEPALSRDLTSLLAPIFDAPVSRWIEPNGLTVIHAHEAAHPLLSAQLWVKTGSIHEGPLLGAGVSHFLEHMLFQGTEKRTGPLLTAEVQAAGGYINAYTTFDRTVYYIDLPSENAATALDLLADMGFASVLPEQKVATERDVILREIAMGQDDPDRRLSRAMFATAFREHPYGEPVIGHADSFKLLRRDHLEATYRSRYAPNNSVLVLVGDVDEDQARALVSEHFGSHPRRPITHHTVPTEPLQLAPREARLSGDVQVTRGGMAYKIPGLRHPDAPALDILATVLGHGDSSILFRSLREGHGLVHHISASAWNPGDEGLLWVHWTCDHDKRADVERAVAEEIARVQSDTLPIEALEKARRLSAAGEINARKTVSGQAGRLGQAEVVLRDLAYPKRYFTRLADVTDDDLRRVAQAHLQPTQLTVTSFTQEPVRVHWGPVSAATPGEIELVTLDNGVRLALQHDPRLPKVHVRFAALGGPLYEDPAQRGATQLLATLLTRDTEYRRAGEVAQTIESLGASFREFAGNNAFGLGLELLAPDLEPGLQILEEALTAPSFDAATVARERDALAAAIREDEDDVVEHAFRQARARFFGSHPLAYDSSGRIETVTTLDPEALRVHFNRLLLGSNAVVAVVGDFDRDEATSLLTLALGALPDYAFRLADAPFSGPMEPGEATLTRPREQAIVIEAFPGSGALSDDYLAGELIDEILSDMSGQLFQRVRDELGLAYFVGAQRTMGLHAGMFTLYAGTRPDAVDTVRQELAHARQRIRGGELTEAEISRARTRLKAQKRQSLQAPGSRAMQMCLNLLYGRPADDWTQYAARLDALTPDDLARFGQLRLDEAQRVGLVVLPG